MYKNAAISPAEWQREVFPHSALRMLAPDLWVVQGGFPAAKLPRNMIVYRFDNDRLLLHSVVALNEESMQILEALGKPSVMVIPHWDHWAHIAAYKKRYPNIDVVCPQASKARVERRLQVEQVCERYFPRAGIHFYTPPGIAPVEGILELPLTAGKAALVMNDLITNVPHQPGFYGKLLRLTGSTGRPRVIPIVRRQLKVKRRIVQEYLIELSQRNDISVLATSHGECLVNDISETLRAVARDLK